MNLSSIHRRQLIQRFTAIALGTGLYPLGSYGLTKPQQNAPTVYIPPENGKKGKVGDMQITFKLNSKNTSDQLGLWETVIQPGELGAPPHYHKNTDEICRVLEGSVFIMTGENITEVKAGGWHLRPKGLVHTFWNSAAVPAKTIDICIPGGHEYYMEELASLFEHNHHPKQSDFKNLEEKHDIHYRFDLLQEIITRYKVKL
jgi:mannose-6-phosphate isomerase-like protein (cupin superfamily)